MISYDKFGPEKVLLVQDPETGTRGAVVVDNSSLGPTGGGTRMVPDLTIEELSALARSMTYKFALVGFPRGGSKAGIWANSAELIGEKRKQVFRNFGKLIRNLLLEQRVAVGPDMGVDANDVEEIYRGAGVENKRKGLFEKVVDSDKNSFHFTGYGVVCSAVKAAKLYGLDHQNLSVAIEGFGQVGAGIARYAERQGMSVRAVSTIAGALVSEKALDVSLLLSLRREHGDDFVNHYPGVKRVNAAALFSAQVDVLIPGARPHSINESNVNLLKTKIVVSGGNVCVTDSAIEQLHLNRVPVIPDSVSTSGAAIASWVDFTAGTTEQAMSAIGRIIPEVTARVVEFGKESGTALPLAAKELAQRSLTPKTADISFEESEIIIKKKLYPEM